MNEFKILDKTIFFLGKKTKKVNNIGTCVYYFNRLTRTSMIPIEVCAVKLNDEIKFFSPQLNSYELDENPGTALYRNSIKFEKAAISSVIDKAPNENMDNKTAELFKNIFGIDLSAIDGIEGLVFDRIIYTENFKINNTELRADGYIFVFTDAALRRAKFGFFAGNIRNKKFNEFVEDLNEYGASNILNNIVVKQESHSTIIQNNTPFHVEIQPYATEYNIDSEMYGEKVYKRVKKATNIIVLSPGQEFTIHKEIPQKSLTYSMLDNVIAEKYINTPFSNTGNEYESQEDMIRFKPYEFEVLRVGIEPDVTFNIEDYALITGFTTIDELDDINYTIINKKNVNPVSVKGPLGHIQIKSDELAYSVSPAGMKERFIKGFANTALFRIDSKQFVFDYTIKEAQTIITEIAFNNAFNNIISEYKPSLVIKTATLADYNEFAYQNTQIKIDNIIPAKGYTATLPYLMKTDLFKNNVLMIDLNEITDMNSRPPYGQYIFKSFVKELDDVIAEYMQKRKQAVSNFKFMDIPLDISTADISEYSPESEIWDLSSKEHNNFAYNVKYHLADLGYEIALEEALKKLKKAAYIFAPVKNVIATNVFGISLDHEWYFIGSNWYRAKEIEKPEITAYVNNKIKSYDVPVDKYRFMYVKKIFFGYDNDNNEMISYAKAFAECIGMNKAIPSDLLIQNAALMYIMEHTIDNERSYPDFKEVVTYPTEFVNKYTLKDIKNKYVFPNIFAKKYDTKFYPGLYSSARRAELERNIENNALDVLNSVEKIEVETSAFLLFDQNVMKSLTSLFTDMSYQILGIEDAKYNSNSVVNFRFNIPVDIIINGYGYDFGIEIFINNERRFGLYYNITTKESYIFIADEVKVTDYAFMIGLFDAMLNYNINTIQGYKFKELGVYAPPEELENDLDPKYLFLPVEHPIPSEYNLCGIAVNYIDRTFFLDLVDHTSISETYDLGKGTDIKAPINIGAQIDIKNKELVLTKNETSVSIPLVSLENLPTETVYYNGFVVKPYKLSKFLSLAYSKVSLRSLTVKVSCEEDYYLTINFGEAQWIETDKKRILIGLDNRGIVYGINVGNHMSDLKTFYSVADIVLGNFADKDLDFKIEILDIEGSEL